MYWGQPWTSFWGHPDNAIAQLSFARLADGRSTVLRCRPAAGFGDVFCDLYLRDRLAAHFFAPEAVTSAVAVNLPADLAFDAAPLGYAVYGVGQWPFPPFSLRAVHLAATGADRGRRARLEWPVAPVLDAVHGDPTGQITTWTLTGVIRNGNLARVPDLATRGRLYWTLVNSGSTRTVKLYTDPTLQHLVAQGSRTGDGVISLTAVGGSNLSSTVTVAYSSDVTAAAWLDLRWPVRYNLYANGGSGAIDFSAPLAVITDNGRDSAFAWASRELAAGDWDFCLRTVSDTGVESANTAVQASFTIVLPPQPPGIPAYVSGTASSGLTFHFDPSPTSGATYRLYRSLTPGASPDTSAPDATAAAGATSIVSSGISGGAGIYAFLLAAVNASGESLNAQTALVALDSTGTVVATPPPAPMLHDWSVEQRTVTLKARLRPGELDSLGQPAATAAWVDFYIAREGDSFDWTSPTASAASVADLNGWLAAQATLPAQSFNGWVQLAARTRTSAGVRSEIDLAIAVRWVYLSDAIPAAVTPAAALIR